MVGEREYEGDEGGVESDIVGAVERLSGWILDMGVLVSGQIEVSVTWADLALWERVNLARYKLREGGGCE